MNGRTFHDAVRFVLARRDLTPLEKNIIVTILDRGANGDGYCYPGRHTLAGYVGSSPRRITEQTASLHERGWLKIDRSQGAKTEYRLGENLSQFGASDMPQSGTGEHAPDSPPTCPESGIQHAPDSPKHAPIRGSIRINGINENSNCGPIISDGLMAAPGGDGYSNLEDDFDLPPLPPDNHAKLRAALGRWKPLANWSPKDIGNWVRLCDQGLAEERVVAILDQGRAAGTKIYRLLMSGWEEAKGTKKDVTPEVQHRY